MRCATLFVFLAGVMLFPLSSGCSDESWNLFKADFQKNYQSVKEEIKRRSIFCYNMQQIHEHNERYKSGKETFLMGVNQFTDWTSEEFRHWLQSGEDNFVYRTY